jgi:hypothetical protein
MKFPVKDIAGQRFGRLVAIEPTGDRAHGHVLWRCRCDCGAMTVVRGTALRSRSTLSCGCYQRDVTLARITKHGDVRTPEYQAWRGIIQRCYNPGSSGYHNYGGRGVTMCDAWRHDYPAFLAHIGRKPSPRHSVDRIDNEKGYEPGNVRWATMKEQLTHTRVGLGFKLLDGQGISLTDMASYLAITRGSLEYAFRRAGVLR